MTLNQCKVNKTLGHGKGYYFVYAMAVRHFKPFSACSYGFSGGKP